MSSKTKATAAKEDGKPALVPWLRFPEFRRAAGWEEKRLGNEGDILSSLTGKAGPDFDAGEARFVTYMNVFSNTFVDPKALRFVDVKDDENQNAVARGDVFFTVSSETPDEVGMSSVLLEELENCYLNSFCALFRFHKSKRPNPVFTGYLLRQPLVRAYFTKKAQGSTRFNLSKDAFRSLPLWVPSPPEQQIIASCLSSVDELIAAQARKLDALKTHKKGLMQQLFPREGETQPRLRFPEFQNKEEWDEETLGGACKMQAGKFVSASKIKEHNANGLFPCYGGNGSRGFTETHTHNGTYPLIGRQGALCGNVKLAMGRFHATEHAVVATPKKGVEVVWLYYLLDLLNLNRFATGQAQPGLSVNVLEEVPVAIPKDENEQHRIASCLTSLDDLIAAQTQKLAALKTHKKGLMQQLFPSPEEVEA